MPLTSTSGWRELHSIVYSRVWFWGGVIVGGVRNNRGMSVALAQPVDVMSSGVAGLA
jgi:hypothetical protein